MADTTSQSGVRREPRFDFKESDLEVTVVRSDEVDQPPVQALPQDISYNGIKLLSSTNLHFEEQVRLQFHSDRAQLNFEVEAEIRWMRSQRDGWAVGCLVATQVPDEYIHALSVAGSIDRRRSHRQHIRVDAQAQLAGDSERFPVKLMNYSSNGLGLKTSRSLDAEQRLRLFIPQHTGDDFVLLATTKWVTTESGETSAGCQVPTDFMPVLKQALLEVEQQTTQEEELLGPFLIGAGAGLAFTLLIGICFGN